ncbi:hypothetical protein ACWDRR_19945 [Kitasatospora sp. NPDC003701]
MSSAPTGRGWSFGRLPSRRFAINQVRSELSLTALDLLARPRTLPLDGELATDEPSRRRHRLLHVPPASPAEPAAHACGSLPADPGATN